MGRPVAAYLVLAGLLVPTTFGLLLLVARLRGWHSSEKYAQKVQNEKPTIAIVVQLLSQSLGLLQICALCTVVSLSFQRHASSSAFSLNKLRFINALFALRLDWNLPVAFLLPLVLFIAFSLVPAALWSGALTPNVVVRNVTEQFRIPKISAVNLSENVLLVADGGLPGDGGCPWVSGDAVDLNARHNISWHGCFSKLPILNSASTASAVNPLPGNGKEKGFVHAKLDRSSYSFIGRSYGTGGSVGVVADPDVQSRLSYTFIEPGLHAQLKCIINDTAAFHLEQTGTSPLLEYVTVGNGTLPEGLSANYGTFGDSATQFGYTEYDVFSWASAHNNASTSYFAFTADMAACGGNRTDCRYGFQQLHGTQCQLDFTAKSFRLYVDNLHRTITATPEDDLEWPSYASTLLYELASEQSYISLNDGAFAGSTLGHAILSNIAILRAYRNESSVTNATMLQGVQDFLADVMDNTLMSYSQARFFNGEDLTFVPANVTQNVVVYGEAKFIYAAICVHFLIVAVCAVEAFRTRFWHRLSNLDILDTASIAVGASYGGSKLAAHVQTMGTAGLLLPGSRPSAQSFTGEVMVRLRDISGAMCAIEPVDGQRSIVDEGTSLGGRSQSPEDRPKARGKYIPLATVDVA